MPGTRAGCDIPRGPQQVPATAEAVRAEKIEIVFLATPAEVSMELAPAMLDAGARVIDLSGAFRLRTPENYARWYRELAHAAGAAGGSRLRAAGVLPGAHSRARGWSPIPAVIPRRRISRSGRCSRPAPSIARPASSATRNRA